MGSSNGERSCCVGIEAKPIETFIDRKNPRQHGFFPSVVYLFLLVIAVCFSLKIAFPARQVDEIQFQEVIETLRNRISILEHIIQTNDTSQEGILPENIFGREIFQGNGSEILERTKRASRKRGVVCHLEGKGGPNIISELGSPLQRPRHTTECILWKQNDREPPVMCNMGTIQDESASGIKYIRIDKRGYYYVYSQLTYRSVPWRDNGHRVILATEAHSTDFTIILKAFAPPRRLEYITGAPESDDTRFSGGMFLLNEGDLLAVYPLRGNQKFVMNGENSYFGVFLLKSV